MGGKIPRRKEKGERRREKGEGRKEKGEGRKEKGEGADRRHRRVLDDCLTDRD
jgi:hypothetical protein